MFEFVVFLTGQHIFKDTYVCMCTVGQEILWMLIVEEHDATYLSSSGLHPRRSTEGSRWVVQSKPGGGLCREQTESVCKRFIGEKYTVYWV